MEKSLKIVQFQVKEDTVGTHDGEVQSITSIYALDENGSLWTCFITCDGQQSWRAIKGPTKNGGSYVKQWSGI